MKITLVIPCFNEADRLKTKDFVSNGYIRFIFVNDGSTDSTPSILKTMESGSHHVLNLDSNLGKAEAVRQGMLLAVRLHPDSEWVGYWDADLATPLNQVDFMLKYSQLTHSEFLGLFGSRVLRLGSRIDRNPLRHIFGRIFVTYSSFMLGSKAYDSQCGAKLFRTHIVKEIFYRPFISRWFFDMEIIQRMNLARYAILECPLEIWRDIDGSKVRPVRDGLKAIIEILKIRNFYGKKVSHP